MRRVVLAILAILAIAAMSGCGQSNESDAIQQRQQETLLAEGTSQVGMPAIHNFRERKLLKDIYEMRDQDGLVTYTYLIAEMTGKLTYLGESIGYGIPAATQFSNPMKAMNPSYESNTLPQADPNGLFSPSSAEGTWVLLKDPSGKSVKPVYVEPRIVVSPFKLNV